jgi:hypothetical protein
MQVQQGPLDRVAGPLIERGGGLIEQQYGRFEGERTRQHHPLLLANGELLRSSIGERSVETGEGERRIDVALPLTQPRTITDVLGDRRLKQRRELGDERDLTT